MCVCVFVYLFFSKLKHTNGRKLEATDSDKMQFESAQNAGNGFLEFNIHFFLGSMPQDPIATPVFPL